MKFKSFSELNQVISEKLADSSLFSGQVANYIKVFQHALTYSENDFTNKLLPTRFDKGAAGISLLYRVKSLLRSTSVELPKLKSTLILEQGRSGRDKSGNPRSTYFDTIVKTIGREHCSIMLTDSRSDLKDFDCAFAELNNLKNRSLALQEKRVLSDIIEVMNRAAASKVFSEKEMQYVKSGFQVFFEEFHLFYQLLKDQQVQVVLTDTHYHKEGAICALRLLGVKVVEIQHGLVATNDLYYVYDDYIQSVRKEALFPDKLLLYGEYWKKLLLQGHEHSADELVVIGDYNFKTGEVGQLNINKQDILFIAAQKNMPEYYVEYTEKLLGTMSRLHPEWTVQLKLHPLEKQPDMYEPLKFHANFQLVGNESDLLELLAAAKIQVSIYSTTFFDALGLDVVNFTVQNFSPSSDYAADIAKEGVALPLGFADDPVAEYLKLKQDNVAFLERAAVYADFDANLLLKSLST
jgi:hypothetical protein